MRSEGRRQIAFHVLLKDAYAPNGPKPAPLDQFVISDGDFEPHAASTTPRLVQSQGIEKVGRRDCSEKYSRNSPFRWTS
jgi:hypothetical protein